MTDNKRITKIVAASLLGDGNVAVPPDGSKNAKYRQPKTEDHRDYCEWMCKELSVITRAYIYEFQPKMQGAKRQIEIRTQCHPFFTKFRERMYPNGHKVVEPHYLNLLDWEFLAIWYQEDGSTVRDKRKQGTYIRVFICSECFSYADNQYLRIKIKEKLGIDFNVKSMRNRGNHGYRLELRKEDINTFMQGIEPFVLPSFSYKICRTVGSSSLLDEDIVRPL